MIVCTTIMNEIENVVIIGGGPAGLAAAVYNARAFLNPLVIEGVPAGGQLMLTSEVENYPGFESILGPELVASMKKHAEKFGTRFVSDNVAKVNSSVSPFEVTLAGGDVIRTKSILVATGASAKWLGLESEQKLLGKGVTACATCDGFFFKNKVVAVVGGGDTAMEEALTLTNFATKVYLIHRRDTFRASQIMQKRVLEHQKIEVLWNTQIDEVLGEQKVEGLKLRQSEKVSSNKNNPVPEKLPLDGLFLAIGHTPQTRFLQGSGVELDEKGYIMTYGRLAQDYLRGKIELSSEKKEHLKETENNHHYAFCTSVLGIFAAGDCADYVYRQAATAVGMGVSAALEIERYLYDVKVAE